jgi:hypothetical protein
LEEVFSFGVNFGHNRQEEGGRGRNPYYFASAPYASMRAFLSGAGIFY